jgi:4-hydroxy-2-oxoglutarate aldolase
MELCAAGRLREARELQAVVARADWVAIQTGFAGVKAAIQALDGYGGVPRAPCSPPSAETMVMITDGLAEVLQHERVLAMKAHP